MTVPPPEFDDRGALGEVIHEFAEKVLGGMTSGMLQERKSRRRTAALLMVMYVTLFLFGLAALGAAVWAGLSADDSTGVAATAVLSALSGTALVSVFFTRPLESLQRDSVQFTWMTVVLNTYWSRLMYQSSMRTVDADLRAACRDAVEDLDQLLRRQIELAGRSSGDTAGSADSEQAAAQTAKVKDAVRDVVSTGSQVGEGDSMDQRLLTAAQSLPPLSVAAWFEIGRLRTERGDIAGAREAFTHVISEGKERVTAGMVRYMLDADVIEIDTDPNGVWGVWNLATVTAKQDAGESALRIGSALEQAGRSADAQRAYSYESDDGREASAVNECRIRLGSLLASSGDVVGAEAVLRRAMGTALPPEFDRGIGPAEWSSRPPNWEDAAVHLTALLASIGRSKEAESVVAEVGRAYPGSLWYLRAKASLNGERPDYDAETDERLLGRIHK